jgi:DUF2934 family protein
MAEKAPGKPRKITSSRKKETEQKTTQKGSTVTPIDQAGLGQNQGKITQGPAISGQSEGSPRQSSPASSQTASRSGAHPVADQSGAGTPPNPVARQSGSSPSVLNPRGSVQEGSHAAGARPSRQDLDERIRHRAYELFERRGRREGFHDEDWAQAEAEILAEFEREKSA